jgi:hypothetical protein
LVPAKRATGTLAAGGVQFHLPPIGVENQRTGRFPIARTNQRQRSSEEFVAVRSLARTFESTLTGVGYEGTATVAVVAALADVCVVGRKTRPALRKFTVLVRHLIGGATFEDFVADDDSANLDSGEPDFGANCYVTVYCKVSGSTH